MKKSVLETVKEYLTGKDFVFAGVLEDHVRAKLGSKASSTSRICRYAVLDGILEVNYQQINNKGPRVCLYRLKQAVESPYKVQDRLFK